MAQTNYHFKTLARDVFRRNFSSKWIEIVMPFTADPWHGIYETYLRITIERYDSIEHTFKTFGTLIKNIELKNIYSIDYYDVLMDYTDYVSAGETKQRRKVHLFIEKYSSNSLNSLILNDYEMKEALELTSKLTSLKDLYISTDDIDIRTILQLMDINQHLEKLTLIRKHRRIDFQILDDYIGVDWSVMMDGDKITMVRK